VHRRLFRRLPRVGGVVGLAVAVEIVVGRRHIEFRHYDCRTRAQGKETAMSELEPPEYVAEHVQAALSADPRINELGIEVTVSGVKVFLTGDVATDARRDAIGEVAAELLPDHEVHNHVTVVDRTHSGGREVVS